VRAALYIAQEEYPLLNPEKYLGTLNDFAQRVDHQLPSERYPLRLLRTINQVLFQELGFHGNETSYYDPRNSYLNEVIERRTGIPITLSLIYLYVAEQLDFPMVGIGMPGHFLVQPKFDDVGIYVDPFHQGEILFPEDCQARLTEIYGVHVTMQPHYLSPVSSPQFLFRILTNLKHVYLNRGDLVKGLAAVERILMLDPDDLTNCRDFGLICYQLGRWGQARKSLTKYLHLCSRHPEQAHQDLYTIQQLLERLEDLGED
jgi:regulator of sirC expression with transglutaminase-like and TPR domain